jgi:hypothetical protein
MILWFRAIAACLLAELLAPFVAWWIRQQERKILHTGRPLRPSEIAFAGNLGVLAPDLVRVFAVERIPLPLPTILLRLADRWQWGCPDPAGMALGNGIYVCEPYAEQPALIHHELVHTLQYQRLGGPWGFIRVYLRQCLRDGYEHSALEVEASRRSLDDPQLS